MKPTLDPPGDPSGACGLAGRWSSVAAGLVRVTARVLLQPSVTPLLPIVWCVPAPAAPIVDHSMPLKNLSLNGSSPDSPIARTANSRCGGGTTCGRADTRNSNSQPISSSIATVITSPWSGAGSLLASAAARSLNSLTPSANAPIRPGAERRATSPCTLLDRVTTKTTVRACRRPQGGGNRNFVDSGVFKIVAHGHGGLLCDGWDGWRDGLAVIAPSSLALCLAG